MPQRKTWEKLFFFILLLNRLASGRRCGRKEADRSGFPLAEDQREENRCCEIVAIVTSLFRFSLLQMEVLALFNVSRSSSAVVVVTADNTQLLWWFNFVFGSTSTTIVSFFFPIGSFCPEGGVDLLFFFFFFLCSYDSGTCPCSGKSIAGAERIQWWQWDA